MTFLLVAVSPAECHLAVKERLPTHVTQWPRAYLGAEESNDAFKIPFFPSLSHLSLRAQAPPNLSSEDMWCGLCSGGCVPSHESRVSISPATGTWGHVGRVLTPLDKVTTSLQPTHTVASLPGGPCFGPWR